MTRTGWTGSPRRRRTCSWAKRRVSCLYLRGHVFYICPGRHAQALRLTDPSAQGYTVRWPFHGRGFNSVDYAGCGLQALLNDIETLWRMVLLDMLKIDKAAYKVHICLLSPPPFAWRYSRVGLPED